MISTNWGGLYGRNANAINQGLNLQIGANCRSRTEFLREMEFSTISADRQR